MTMSADLATRIQEDHLTCQICFQAFTKPKALPCLHTFCEECLREYIVSRSYDTQGRFQCPVCRKDIEIPSGGVSAFQDNHLVQSLSHTVTGPETGTANTNRVPAEGSDVDPPFRPTPAPRKSKMKAEAESESDAPTKPPPETPPPSYAQVHQMGGALPPYYPHDPQQLAGLPIPPKYQQAQPGMVPPQYPLPLLPPPYKYPHPQAEELRVPVNPAQLPNPLPSTGLYPDLPVNNPELPKPGVIACSNGLVGQIGKYGPNKTDFQRPKGLAIGLNNEVIVSDLGGNRILVFSQAGHLLCFFECDCIVHDLTVTPKGTILVAVNKAKSAIMREYSMSGRLLANHGNYYKFENPSGIALNSEGFSIVTCLESCVMYIFTEQKKMSQKVGSKGSGTDHFLTPYHVAVNNKDQIYVSDCGNNCVKVFSKAGKFKMNIGKEGSGTGELRAPLGVCTNIDGYIFVADSGNFRVQVFSPKGQYYCVPLQHTQKIGRDVKPTNVAVTSDNSLVVLLSGAQYAEVRIYSFKSENGLYCSTCYVQ